MKELSIEDKAKAYDELIKRLNKAREDVGGYTFKSMYDEVMSELAESGDEKIRKALIKGFKRYFSESVFNGILVKDILAWLEKQGEKGINGKNREIPFSEQKPAWSEEDEKYLIYNIEQDYRDKLNNNPSESLRPYYNKVISWLKSLRPQKVQKVSKEDLEKMGKQIAEYNKLLEQLRPQNAWKPSEEEVNKIISIDQQICDEWGILKYTNEHKKVIQEIIKRFIKS